LQLLENKPAYVLPVSETHPHSNLTVHITDVLQCQRIHGISTTSANEMKDKKVQRHTALKDLRT